MLKKEVSIEDIPSHSTTDFLFILKMGSQLLPYPLHCILHSLGGLLFPVRSVGFGSRFALVIWLDLETVETARHRLRASRKIIDSLVIDSHRRPKHLD